MQKIKIYPFPSFSPPPFLFPLLIPTKINREREKPERRKKNTQHNIPPNPNTFISRLLYSREYRSEEETRPKNKTHARPPIGSEPIRAARPLLPHAVSFPQKMSTHFQTTKHTLHCTTLTQKSIRASSIISRLLKKILSKNSFQKKSRALALIKSLPCTLFYPDGY